MNEIIVDILTTGAFQTNTYILHTSGGRDALIIDPGDGESGIDEIMHTVIRNGLTIRAILLTHGHIDHAGAVSKLKEATGAKTYIHKADMELLESVALQASLFGLTPPEVATIDTYMEDGMYVGLKDLQLRAIYTPGHTPGSVSFLLDHPGDGKIFTGDTIFKGGVGRTDLWGGSHQSLMKSIRDRILTLSDHIVIYPGHGPSTTVGNERKENPFILSSH